MRAALKRKVLRTGVLNTGGRDMNNMPKSVRIDYSAKLVDILNYGALNLAMGIGYRCGLFEVMDRLESPQSVPVIAEKAGLDARYVKEWLGVMVTGGMIALENGPDGEDLFSLPRQLADLVTLRAGSANLGVYTQEIPLLTACAFDAVVDGFKTGEGVPFSSYPPFHGFMAELANAKHRQVLVDTFLPSVESGALIPRLVEGIAVCDLGCAEGVAVRLMAEAFPNSRFVGLDISGEAIGTARAAAVRSGLGNVEFVVRDAAEPATWQEFGGAFDYVTAFDAIHDQTRPLQALQGIRHMLSPAGVFSMVDIAAATDLAGNLSHPMGPFLYTVSLMHCMPVGLYGGGAGLGMMWGRQAAVAMLKQAGFSEVTVADIPQDPFNLHFFCRR